MIVDDILRTGKKLAELKRLLESRGATVVGLAVIIYQPTPDTHDFGNLPLYYLAKLDARYYADAAHCELCKRGVALEKVWIWGRALPAGGVPMEQSGRQTGADSAKHSTRITCHYNKNLLYLSAECHGTMSNWQLGWIAEVFHRVPLKRGKVGFPPRMRSLG